MPLNSLARTETSVPVPAADAPAVPGSNGVPDTHPYPAYLNGYGGPIHTKAAGRPNGPSLIDTLLKLSLKRWRLLTVWTVVSAVAAFAVAKTFARTIYTAEGSLIYIPEDNWKRNEYFKPPEMQTLVQLLRSPELIEQARKEVEVPASAGTFQRGVSISPMKGATQQLLSVSVEAPDPTKAARAVNRLMELCVEKYDRLRSERLDEAAAHLEEERKKAIERRDLAVSSYQSALDRQQVEDPLAQRAAIERDISNQETELDRYRASRTTAERELAALKRDSPDADGPAKASDPAPEKIDESMFPPERREKLYTERTAIAQLRESLKFKQQSLAASVELHRRGAIPRNEVDQARAEVKQLELQIKGCQDRIRLLFETPLPAAAPGGAFAELDPARRGRRGKAELQRQIDELKSLITACQENLDAKRKTLGKLAAILRELHPLEQERDAAGLHLQKITEDLAVVNGLRSGGKAAGHSELRVWGQAPLDGGGASASNSAKLLVLVLSAGMVFFVGFIAAVELPKAVRPETKSAELSVPVLGHLPEPEPQTPARPDDTPQPVPAPAEPVRSLALGLGQGVVERGSIILFTPLNEKVRIESVVAELGRFYARDGEPVLLFDARAEQNKRVVAERLTPSHPARVEAFLEGETDDPATCFAPTQVAALEYTRGDLVRGVNDGMMGMYRFRRLLDEMRQRYSRVLMIAPTVCDPADMEMLTTVSESVVLVVPDSTSADEVDPYVHNLRNADARVAGAVVVGGESRNC